jgi:hypothetical protein
VAGGLFSASRSVVSGFYVTWSDPENPVIRKWREGLPFGPVTFAEAQADISEHAEAMEAHWRAVRDEVGRQTADDIPDPPRKRKKKGVSPRYLVRR